MGGIHEDIMTLGQLLLHLFMITRLFIFRFVLRRWRNFLYMYETFSTLPSMEVSSIENKNHHHVH